MRPPGASGRERPIAAGPIPGLFGPATPATVRRPFRSGRNVPDRFSELDRVFSIRGTTFLGGNSSVFPRNCNIWWRSHFRVSGRVARLRFGCLLAGHHRLQQHGLAGRQRRRRAALSARQLPAGVRSLPAGDRPEPEVAGGLLQPGRLAPQNGHALQPARRLAAGGNPLQPVPGARSEPHRVPPRPGRAAQ